MFVPKTFEETDNAVLHQAMRDIGVGIVISDGPDGLMGSHLPMELDTSGGGLGVLRCHFAYPNPHVTTLPVDRELLVIFQGPQTYITPNWYPGKARDGKVVPTWNYAAIHAYGVGATYENRDKLHAHLRALSDHFERRGAVEPKPWSIDDAPADYIEQMMGGITGVEIPITRLQGKWKMSQNRAPADRQGVVDGLRVRGREMDVEVANAVEAALATKQG